MLKKATLLAALMLAPTSAMALTVGSNYITGTNSDNGSAYTYYDAGAEAVSLVDLTRLSSTAMLILEDAGYASTNTFGIYGFTADSAGIHLGNTLQVFSGSNAPLKSRTLLWSKDLVTNIWTVRSPSTETSAQIGTTFGFYIDPNGDSRNRLYSHSSLNVGGLDYFRLYDTSDHMIDDIGGSTVVIGIEDLVGGGDGDYNDMVVGASDVTPVPEPGTMMLLGAGFLGLAIYGKRRKNA